MLTRLMYEDYFDEFINKYLNFIEIYDNFEIKNKHHNIKVKEVFHKGIEAYGFVIDSKLGITGDSSLCDSIMYISNNSSIMICDCSQKIGDEYHMGIDDVKKLLGQNKNLQIIPTHYRDSTKEQLTKMDLENILIVDDGYKFEMEN